MDMRSVSRDAARRKQQQHNIDEANRILLHLTSLNPAFKHRDRTTSAVAKILLLKELVFSHGEGFTFRAKSVGCGIYEVWVEPTQGGE